MVMRESEVEELKTIVLNPLFLRYRCVPLTPILESAVKSEESTKCCQREILDVFFFFATRRFCATTSQQCVIFVYSNSL